MKKFVTLTFAFFPFWTNAQTNNAQYQAHEWGTFTTLCGSDGNRLNGLFVDEEKLPYFVGSISPTKETNPHLDYKGFTVYDYRPIPLVNVNVKMETPVIYFYADKPVSVDVDVRFPRGSISQWYPPRQSGEPFVNIRYDEDTLPEIDFKNDANGFISWKADILGPENKPPFTFEDVPEIWSTPRAPKSNRVTIAIHGLTQIVTHVESYLFYRGIGNFEIPIKGQFLNDNQFVVQNSGSTEAITYFIYERTPEDGVIIHESGALESGYQKTISLEGKESSYEVKQQFKKDFLDALVINGLTFDEANAMLNTWEKSYFHTPGFKVFWILPRDFTDELLPLTLTPKPTELERIMVGRSEFLKPAFERKLIGQDMEFWQDDRYRFAYAERQNQISNPHYHFALGVLPEDKGVDMIQLQIYPNPTSSELTVKIIAPESVAELEIELMDVMGNHVKQWTAKLVFGKAEVVEDISNLTSGSYFIRWGNSGQGKLFVKL